MKKFYQFLIDVGSNLQSVFLLLVRLFWGGSFFFAGLGKLQNISQIAGFFSDLGIPFPMVSAFATGLVECICGGLLVLGLGARLAVFPLIIVMIVAFYTAHYDALVGAFQDSQEFIKQSPFTYLLASLIIFIFGPGKISLDYLIEKRLK